MFALILFESIQQANVSHDEAVGRFDSFNYIFNKNRALFFWFVQNTIVFTIRLNPA